jgi:three-Cys-motif partner protein
MAKGISTTWPIEPHTEAKHAILRKYMDAWLPIITRWNGRVLYIDGFAGPGEYSGGKDGSPIIATKAVLDHKIKITSEIKMLFIEADKNRCDHLKKVVAKLPLASNIEIECICNKFADTIADLIKYTEEQKVRLAPAFVFIDPFGFTGIPFSLIKQIMKNDKCEVLITFMYEEINRFVSDKQLWPSLAETFGIDERQFETDEWQEIINEKDSKRRELLLHNAYKERLEKEANIQFVRSFKMTNKINKTDYFLFFGTNNLVGLKKMKEAMWKIDESGMFNFSDATYNPAQPTLFQLKPNYDELKMLILKEFNKKAVSVLELENFILTQTPYRETHYKKHVLYQMERAQPPEIKVKSDKKRRKGSFLPGFTVEFL